MNPQIVSATITDYPIIQNMARFYVYDMSRYCAVISDEWNIPKDGLYECFDFKNYFTDPARKAFAVKVGEALAGFVLLDRKGTSKDTEWNMGEFFILAQFQGKRIAEKVAYEIWKMHPGSWEVSVIPENTKALAFWRHTIDSFTNGHYTEELKKIDFDEHQPNRYILSFCAQSHDLNAQDIQIHKALNQDIPAMVVLSYQKRRDYEQAQSQFWKYAEGAEAVQTKWFAELLERDDYIILIAKSEQKVIGFTIGRIIPCPEVYEAGLTLMIDDFCVESPSLWESVGKKLIEKICTAAKLKNAKQILIVSGHHDKSKRRFLKTLGLGMASEWYVGKI